MPRLTALAADTDLTARLTAVTAELLAAEADREQLQESLASYELMLEDRGWDTLGRTGDDLTSRGRGRARDLCRLTAIAHPLVKRGLLLRGAYVWGDGVSITGRDTSDGKGQDINAVLQEFLEANRGTIGDAHVRAGLEWALGTDGELFPAMTADGDGGVSVRMVPPEQIVDRVCDPDDDTRPWLYLRRFTTRRMDDLGGFATTVEHVAYPAAGYRRAGGWPDTVIVSGQKYRVEPETFIRHVAVNVPSGDAWRGIPDAFAALPWARGYKEFLEQWATLMAALSQFAYTQATPKGKAKQAADAALRAVVSAGNTTGAGATYTAPDGYRLSAVSTSGARFDADSGRPLAAMVAAALGLPVTMLLADPGVTGARATAETLDQPTENEMKVRRSLWADVFRDLINHAVDEAVLASNLVGKVVRRGDRDTIVLPDEGDRAVDFDWPDFDSTPMLDKVKAIQAAEQVQLLPPLTLARLLAAALGVENIDDLLDELTDDQGRWIGPGVNAGAAAVDAFNRGDDPAAALN